MFKHLGAFIFVFRNFSFLTTLQISSRIASNRLSFLSARFSFLLRAGSSHQLLFVFCDDKSSRVFPFKIFFVNFPFSFL